MRACMQQGVKQSVYLSSVVCREVWKVFCTVEFVSVIKASKFVSIKVESVLDSISMISGYVYAFIDDLFSVHYNCRKYGLYSTYAQIAPVYRLN